MKNKDKKILDKELDKLDKKSKLPPMPEKLQLAIFYKTFQKFLLCIV